MPLSFFLSPIIFPQLQFHHPHLAHPLLSLLFLSLYLPIHIQYYYSVSILNNFTFKPTVSFLPLEIPPFRRRSSALTLTGRRYLNLLSES